MATPAAEQVNRSLAKDERANTLEYRDRRIPSRTSITTLTAGAPGATLPVDSEVVEINATGAGANNMVLPNGQQGQRILLLYVTEAAGGVTAVVTPTRLAGASTTITFAAPGDNASLEYSIAVGWFNVSLGGPTPAVLA